MIHNNDARAMLERMCGGVILCNFDPRVQGSTVVYANRGWMEITGYSPELLASEHGGNPQALIVPEDKAQADADYTAQMSLGGQYELMYRIFRRGGQIRWVVDKGVVTTLPGGILQNLSVITDVTKIKEQEQAMRLLAQQDQLTELCNKATFTDTARTVLGRQSERLHAMLMMDIDGFKAVNDSCGHAAGDKVLEMVALQLKERFRSRDVVGRVGGDEFAVLMTDLTCEDSALEKAGELCTAVRRETAGQPGVTVSIGVAFSAPGKDFEALFREADAALYQAKNSGKNQHRRWSLSPAP